MKENRIQLNTDICLSMDILGYLTCEEAWSGTAHSHPFWELVISTFDFSEFDIELFCPNETHNFTNANKATKHLLYIGFNFRHDTSLSPEKIRDQIMPFFRDESNLKLYESLFQKIAQNTQIPKDTNFYVQIFVFLISCVDKYMFKVVAEHANTALISEVKKYIASNLDKKINVQQLSKSFYITPKYLGQIFRKETGEGILQYAKRKKMEKALLLLKTKELSVTQISEMLGFDNVHFFSSTFKSYFNFSPTIFLQSKE